MQKSTFTLHYDLFRARLLALRRAAGLTQRALAARLGREQSFIGRIELGERRVDLVEFFWICQACGQDPEEQARAIMGLCRQVESLKQAGRRSPAASADEEARLIASAQEAPEPYQAGGTESRGRRKGARRRSSAL